VGVLGTVGVLVVVVVPVACSSSSWACSSSSWCVLVVLVGVLVVLVGVLVVLVGVLVVVGVCPTRRRTRSGRRAARARRPDARRRDRLERGDERLLELETVRDDQVGFLQGGGVACRRGVRREGPPLAP
jgi:uncharacterized membrane protein